jgi:hypothetical protein
MRMLRRVENNPVSRIGDCYSSVNLNSFSSHGGKLIFYHGVSDPWFSAKDTIDYYQRMTAANGRVKSHGMEPACFFRRAWATAAAAARPWITWA